MARTKKKRRRKGGRPRGSRAQDYHRVAVVSTRCPRCGSSDRHRVKGAAPIARPFAGTLAVGQRRVTYNRVVRRLFQCDGCGQRYLEVTYEQTGPAEKVPGN